MKKTRHNHHHKHGEQCGICKRPIWIAESVSRKMGPVCAKKGIQPEQEQLKEMVRQIVDELLTGKPAPFRKALAYSNRRKWLANKKLVEGW